jgi:hypothetical protein
MKKVFIGGSRKISKINNEIKKRIDNIIKQNFTILIGDANGVDKSVQKYLTLKEYNKVYVFCTGNKCRNNVGEWGVRYIETNLPRKGYEYYVLKDIEMAKEADYGLMIWDGKSRGTLNNVINLITCNKKCLLFITIDNAFYNIRSINDVQSLLPKYHEIKREMFLPILSPS